jgi:hypothetical protein
VRLFAEKPRLSYGHGALPPVAFLFPEAAMGETRGRFIFCMIEDKEEYGQ